jgi:hypothetical protein
MFTSQQILTASRLVKDFTAISKLLEKEAQALLITQKSRKPLVLVDAEVYEEMLYRIYDCQCGERLPCGEASDFKSTFFADEL